MCAGVDDMGVQVCEADGTWGECDCGGTDTDVDTDTDTYTDCTPNAYQQCGIDDNVHWFDSCDVEGAEFDDCDDACETCENTSATTAECQATTLSGVQAIAAVGKHTCVLLEWGGVKCWGHNYYGQLGDGTTDDSSTPVDVFGLSSGVQDITAGGLHTCAMLDSGGMKCWGQNLYGQLGDGTTEYKTTPVDVVGLFSGVQAIGAGVYHTCAVLTTGGVKCWGCNYEGQLGDGTTSYSTATPVDVFGLSSGVQAIAAGWEHTCALLTSGGVKCWGDNEWGQLGDGTTDDSSTPVDVVGLPSGVQALAADGYHTCALLTSGGVMCWGGNEYGQLGNEISGPDEYETTPVAVSGLSSGVQAIAAGIEHTCAVPTSGDVMCWGDNEWGQLGDGTTDDNSTPVDVSGLTSGVQAAAAGEKHTCALLTSGGVKCWGGNEDGQLGDGTMYDSLTPVDVCPGL